MELCLRLQCHRFDYFINEGAVWNHFEFVLATVSLIEIGLQHSSDMSFMRIFE